MADTKRATPTPDTKEPIVLVNPIVHDLRKGGDGKKKKKKKKKKKYSPGLAPFQRMERTMSKAQRRAVRAVMEGLDTWDRERTRSSRKNKDGAMRDAFRNMQRAMSKTARQGSKVPGEMAKGMRVGRMMKSMPPMVFFIR